MRKLSGIYCQRFIPKSMPLLRQTLFFVVINTFAYPTFEKRLFICQGLSFLFIYLFSSYHILSLTCAKSQSELLF